MLGNISNIQSGMKNFVLNHKVLTILALGAAILGIVFRGKIYSWIQKASTTTQRTEQTGTQILTNSPSVTPKHVSADRDDARPTQQIDQPATTPQNPPHLQNNNSSNIDDKLSDVDDTVSDDSDEDQPNPVDLTLQEEIIRAAEIELPSSNNDQARELQIIPFFYIGNADAIGAINSSTENNPIGYTKVIRLAEESSEDDNDPFYAMIPDTIEYWSPVYLNDKKETWDSIIDVDAFDSYFDMIDESREEEEPILFASSNPQLGVVGAIAYLMSRCDVTVDQALHFINTKGCNAQLTVEFRARLQEYYESFLDDATS